MKNVFKEAHKLTKEIKKEYPEVDYRAQFGICLSFLLNKKEEKEMVELEGSPKQVAWAEDIKKELLEDVQWHIDNINSKEFLPRPWFKTFKDEIKEVEETKGRKLKKEELQKILLDIMYVIKENIEKETKATRFIDQRRYIKTGLLYRRGGGFPREMARKFYDGFLF